MRALGPALALGVAVAGMASSQTDLLAESRGPLRTVTAHPMLLPFLVPSPEPATGLPPGSLEVAIRATYGNAFHFDPFLLYPDLYAVIDMEVMKLSLEVNLGLPAGFTAGLGIPFVAQYGGFADPAIEAFHSLFGFPNSDRDRVRHNHYAFRLVRSGVEMVTSTDPGVSLGDLLVRLKWSVVGGIDGVLSVALQAALKIPTGSLERFASSGALDAAAGVLLSWPFAGFEVDAGLTYLRLGTPRWPTVLGFDPDAFAFFCDLQKAVTRQLTVAAQVQGITPPYESRDRWIGAVCGSISVGFEVYVSPSTVLQFYVAEELPSRGALDIAAGFASITRVRRLSAGPHPAHGQGARPP
jgi:hypothetical protein